MRGKWHGEPLRLRTGWLLQIETQEPPQIYDKTKDKEITIDIKKYYEKRSNDANSYYHVLAGKIAKALGISMTESCNKLIAEYGEPDPDFGQLAMLEEISWTRIDSMHLRPTTQIETRDGKLYRTYIIMRGSHTYNTREMGRLLDGVIFEAKALGIPTETPEEIERLKQLWEEEQKALYKTT